MISSLMSDLPNLLIAWGIHATGVLSPGPGVALILGIATAEGRRPALTTCLGISAGSLLLGTLTVVGLAAILAEVQPLLVAAKWFGVAYLLWLAHGAFRKAASPPPPPAAAGAPHERGTRRLALAGFLFQIANPKAMLFWIAFAAVAGLGEVSGFALLLFLTGAWAISFAGHGGWALLLSSAPFRALYARARRWVEAGLGAVFGLGALKLATERG